jgi:hypothetical protein
MDFKSFIKHAAKAASTVAHHAGAKDVPVLDKVNKKIKKKLNEEEEMNGFETFLAEGRRFAYSKDGVRKEVKSDAEAANWKDTIAKPAKSAPAKKEAIDYTWLSHVIMTEVSQIFPDNDGFEQISRKFLKKYPHVDSWDVRKHIDKACKQHLNMKDFDDYIDHMEADGHGHRE